MYDQLQVLIIGEAESQAALKRDLIAHHGNASVTQARHCSDAIEAIRKHRFDCIFLDYDLPDGNGLICLLDLRALESPPPIIVMTRHADDKLAVEMLKAGAADYLSIKELTPSLLDHCLRGAIRYQQAQDQVRRANEELRLRDRAIAAASNGIVIADPSQPDCPIIYCNPAFTTITGYSSEEVLGRNCRFLQGPESDPNFVKQMQESIALKQECHIVLKNYRKNGSLFWNDLTISPVRDRNGSVTHFVGVQTDITERKIAEDALKQSAIRQQTLLRDMFSSVTEGKLTLCGSPDDFPPVLNRFVSPIPLSRTGGIRELRQHTLSACLAAEIPNSRRYDLETAVGEAAMNAVVHAKTGIGHIFTHDRGTVQVRIEDEGRGIALEDLPNATLRRGYSSIGTMGHGFKMMLQTVDQVHLLTGPMGTTVVLTQERVSRLPSW